MEYLIRDFREGDIGKLILLCGKHAAHEHADYVSFQKEDRLCRALISPSPPLHCWIVTVKDEIVGYATFTFDFSTWDALHYLHLDCLFIEENFRGYGIGQEIIRRLKNVAKKNNCVNVQWQTPVFNEQAIRFYRRLGGKSLDKKRFTLAVGD